MEQPKIQFITLTKNGKLLEEKLLQIQISLEFEKKNWKITRYKNLIRLCVKFNTHNPCVCVYFFLDFFLYTIIFCFLYLYIFWICNFFLPFFAYFALKNSNIFQIFKLGKRTSSTIPTTRIPTIGWTVCPSSMICIKKFKKITQFN